jgi:hypothetical protein
VPVFFEAVNRKRDIFLGLYGVLKKITQDGKDEVAL